MYNLSLSVRIVIFRLSSLPPVSLVAQLEHTCAWNKIDCSELKEAEGRVKDQARAHSLQRVKIACVMHAFFSLYHIYQRTHSPMIDYLVEPAMRIAIAKVQFVKKI